MGLFRFLLAISVVIAHSEPMFGVTLVGGVAAVQAFYIISGFYMALILSEKYTGPGSYGVFITNRFLRLFPVYWAVLFLSVLLSFVYLNIFNEGLKLSFYLQYFGLMELKARIIFVFTNFFIFGQDIVMFLKLDSAGALAYTSDFNITDTSFPAGFSFLFVPQAWTLALEIMFYIIAPFLVRRSVFTLALIICSSLALRVFIYGTGLTNDPWTYRFFPMELAFFFLGAVSYKLYRIKRETWQSGISGKALLVLLLSYTVLYQFLPSIPVYGFDLKQWLFYGAAAVSIPAVFSLSKNWKLDNFMGELSYPIYISHLFILNATTYKFYSGPYREYLLIVSLALTIIFSIVLVRYIVRPIETYRQRRVSLVTVKESAGAVSMSVNQN